MPIVQKLFSASGRIRRRDFWLWWIVALVVNVLVSRLSQAFLNRGDDLVSIYGLRLATSPALLAATLGNAILITWIDFNLVAKRLHDRNKPALVAGIVPIVNVLCVAMAFAPNAEATDIATKLMAGAMGIWVFVECGCLDGTKGPNKYGPSPKNIPAPADVF